MIKNGGAARQSITYCAVRGGGFKYPKLTELADFYEIFDYDVTRKSIELFGDGAAGHDARFDVTQTYLSLIAATEKHPDIAEKINIFLKNQP